MTRAVVVVAACLVLSACGGGGDAAKTPSGGNAATTPTVVRVRATLAPITPIADLPTMALESVFPDGGSFPSQHTCEGLNTSPPLRWRDAPAETKSFVVFVDDPDAGGIFSHWVIYNIPQSSGGLAGAIPTATNFDDGTQQGVNSAGEIGYTGPCPPSGALHRYRLYLYAVDERLPSTPGLSKTEVVNAINGHIVAHGSLTATYLRP